MTDNLHSVSAVPIHQGRKEAWLPKVLSPFLSSAITITLGLLFLGARHRAPEFFTSLRFLLPLVGCSVVPALVLWHYRAADWLVRALLAPLIGVPLFFLVTLLWRG